MENKKDCTLCWQYRSGFCKQWKQTISDTGAAETCGKFSTQKILNKGMQIRQNKLNRQARTRAKVKPEQEELVCFVDFSEKIIERINGKYRRPTRTERGRGLQIKNKIYLENGKHKMVNRTTLSITKKYEGVPAWANDFLKNLYSKPIDNASMEKTATKPVRKRCNTCVHFLFGYNESKHKDGYYCELTKEFAKDYNQLKHCMAPQYKRKPQS